MRAATVVVISVTGSCDTFLVHSNYNNIVHVNVPNLFEIFYILAIGDNATNFCLYALECWKNMGIF